MSKILKTTSMLLALSSSIFISCKDDAIQYAENLCNVRNPETELIWLKNAIEEFQDDQYSYFNSAQYEGNVVFFSGNCNPSINYVSFVQNCNGDTLGFTNEISSDLDKIKLLWKADNSLCDL
ncbi:hypothetical protein SAMN05661096_02372 [Marivirga sericea]|uniref:Lipoprotein n=1 Tax=Marivirga sericea TaxID=1028 RepID=A0A1X7K4X4_9BACT|nr:hypothetical protein [Marivirga sericea]SMG35742.1 hypothetical protein SAMN05661096_02372 [Marivirga sericea]